MDFEICFKDSSITITTSHRYSDTHYESIYIRWMLCRWCCIMALWYLLCTGFDI